MSELIKVEEGRKGDGQCRREAEGNPGRGASTLIGMERGVGNHSRSGRATLCMGAWREEARPREDLPLAVSSGWRVSTTEVIVTRLGFRKITLKMVEGETGESKN